jgi:hypothetical protein
MLDENYHHPTHFQSRWRSRTIKYFIGLGLAICHKISINLSRMNDGSTDWGLIRCDGMCVKVIYSSYNFVLSKSCQTFSSEESHAFVRLTEHRKSVLSLCLYSAYLDWYSYIPRALYKAWRLNLLKVCLSVKRHLKIWKDESHLIKNMNAYHKYTNARLPA